MTPDELAAGLLAHAEWMVSSGQCRMTVRRYLECLHPSDHRDEALRLLAEKDAEAADGAVATTDEEE